MWKTHPKFYEIVKEAWQENDVGTPMFRCVQKLRRLKRVLAQLNKSEFSNIQNREMEAKGKLEICQNRLREEPLNFKLLKEEQESRRKYAQVRKAYISFLTQKARLIWLNEGDQNTAFYHAAIKKRSRANRILSIVNEDGVRVMEATEVINTFVHFYKTHLGYSMPNRLKVKKVIMANGNSLDDNQKRELTVGE